MAMQNIGEGNAADAFYRYKRPKLVARIEGRGNGIKTNVVNNVDLAKALERSPDYILKFFGCELGAQTKFDKATGTSIVNGAHDVGKLDELLEAFTKKYVQCYGCGNPETRIKIRKENIFLACKACGFVSEVDMRHRLNTYILKNPPEDKLSKAEKKLKKMEKERLKEAAGDHLDKEAKEAKKKKKDSSKKDGLKSATKGKKNGEGSPTPSAGEEEEEEDEEPAAEEEVVWMTDTSSAAVAARAKEQLTEATAALVTQGNIELEAADQRRREREAKKKAEEEARAEAEKQARLKAEEEKRLAEEAAALQLEADKEDAEVDALRKLIGSATPVAVAEAVKKLEAEGGVAGRMRILYEALFGDIGSAKLAGAMAKNNTFLKANALDPASQMAQLVALEHLISVLPDKLKEVALALKVLYDEDIADEQFILAWYDKPSAAKVLGVEAKAAQAVRFHAGPFVEWLRSTVESDSEEEEDEESEEE